MVSMKIVQFSRPPLPRPPSSSIYDQDFFTPLTLDVQFQTNPAFSNGNK